MYSIKELRNNPHIQESFADHLKTCGYALIEVEPEHAQAISLGFASALKFFKTPPAQKWLSSLRTEGVGYASFAERCREYFTVKLPSKGFPFPWPDNPADFETHLSTLFRLHQSLGTDILKIIQNIEISKGKKFSHDFMDLLDTIPQALPYSSSVMFVRKFSPVVLENVRDHTKEHTDSGILTILPMSNVLGLEVLRWDTMEWVQIKESFCRPEVVVVMVGETLSFLTQREFKAAVHRVNQQGDEDRISFPFQLRVDSDKIPKENYGSILSSAKVLSFHAPT